MKRYISPAMHIEDEHGNDLYEVSGLDRLFTRDEIFIPDFGGWITLKCDLHTHTVFSDGLVWPDQRVYEAWQEGLDAVAITDHLSYRINSQWLKGDLNDAYLIARKAADDLDFIVIQGAEITEYKPIGHFNTLFIHDANRLKDSDPVKVIREAVKQGAFISWNHPGWPDNEVDMYPVHEKLLKENLIHGIEVMNYKLYCPSTLRWCIEYGKAPLATADAHCTTHSMFSPKMRPMTLVFASDRSLEGIKDALFAGRSAAFFDGKLAGEGKYLEPLVRECLKVGTMKNGCVQVTNLSDIPYDIFRDGHATILPGRSTVIIAPSQGGKWEFRNCFVDSDRCLELSF